MGAIEFRLLGPMELRINGSVVELGTAKQRAVLAVLLASAGRPVTVDALVDRVWDDEPPGQVRNTVYSYMSRLRGLFRGHMAAPLVRAGGGGYVLDVPQEAVDMHRFRRLAERALESATAEHTRRDLFCEALNQWQGTPLAGLSGTWAERVRHGLEQQRINAAAEWAALELRLGTPETVIDQLTALVPDHPLAEVLSWQLIRALHRAGRDAEAVAHYGVVRRRIMAELGVQPSHALRAIHREITAAEPEPVSADEPVWVGLRPHLTRLFGRAEESAGLSQLLDTARLITVTGVGGCGKSALALEVAAGFARRRRRPGLALALATVTSAEQAVHTLAALLGASDHNGDARHAVEQILTTGPRLLVLDNCEHLAAGIAELVSGLLRGCPELQVLATSRQPLGVTGETVFPLAPLSVPPRSDETDRSVLTVPAVELFVERIHQAAPSVTIDDAAVNHVAELCRRLDGLPLALELVAARARTFPLAELVECVNRDLTLLFHTSRDDDSRHATMDATLDWSFRLLSASQRRLFARMSIFSGGFTTPDVQAVCEFAPLAPGMVPALLAALVDRSLVQPYDVDGGRRYRLLNVVRTYAAARLVEFGEHTTTARHHLDRWLALAREIDEEPRYGQRVRRWQVMAVDVANLRQSLEFGLGAERCLDAAEIIAKAFEFWMVNKGYLLEGRTWLLRALSLQEVTERPDVHALLRFHHALLVKMSGDNLGGMALMQPAVTELAGRRPREHLEAQACVLSAKMAALDPSVLDDVEPILATALTSSEDDDVLTVVNAAGTVLNTWGRYDRTLELNAVYDRRDVVLAHSSIAAKLAVKITAVLGTGDLTNARALMDELVALLDAIAHAAEHSAPRRVIALGYLVGDQPGKARQYLDNTLSSLHTTQAPLSSRFVHLQVLLAEAQRRCGDVTTATRTLRDALAAAVSTDFQQSISATLCAALLAADLGDDGASRRLAGHWDTVRRQHGLPAPVGFASAAETLGLDPAPRHEPAGRWNRAALTSCVDSARDWCTQQS